MMHFQTPSYVCEYMVDLAGIHLDDGYSVLEPTPGEGNLAKAIQNRFNCDLHLPEDFYTYDHLPYYNHIIMNPPFTPMKVCYDILYKCMEMTENIVALMPWLTLINGEKRLKKILDYGLISITHLPRNVFKGARVQTCILHMDKHYYGKTTFFTL